MLELNFHNATKILCLGAHSDDIEIGCGGTILKWVRERPGLNVRWVVFSADGKRRAEAQTGAKVFLNGAGRKKTVVKQFKTSFFPFQGSAIKKFFETLKSFEPDVVFVHHAQDRHQDHRLLSELAWNTFRRHVILEYEIPKYDGDLSSPNLFIRLDERIAVRKAREICRIFQTQGKRHWFSEESFLALMRLRGIECATRYAEAFYCRKIVGA